VGGPVDKKEMIGIQKQETKLGAAKRVKGIDTGGDSLRERINTGRVGGMEGLKKKKTDQYSHLETETKKTKGRHEGSGRSEKGKSSFNGASQVFGGVLRWKYCKN